MEIKITVGEEGPDYQVPEFLRAIDLVVCWFKQFRIQNDNQIVDALELYAKHMREE